MAKPDCDDGWHKIAYELEAAICFANFTKPALTLLRCGFAQIYGKGDRPAVMHLPQIQVASQVGQDRQTIHRAIEELVGSGVLIRVSDDRYRFVKDYERWKTWTRTPAGRGKDRLSPLEVADCKRAPAYAESFRVRPATAPAGPESECVDESHLAYTHTEVYGSSSGTRLTSKESCKPDGLQLVNHPAYMQSEVIRITSQEEKSVTASEVIDLRRHGEVGTNFALNSNTEKEREEEDPEDAREGDGVIPLTDEGLIGWLPCVTDDPDDLKRLRKKVPLWLERIRARCPRHAGLATEWVQDAIVAACDKDDIVNYAQGVIGGYVAEGGRRNVELAPRPKAVPDETDVVAAPASGAHRPARLSYADRVRADRERLLASFDTPSEPEARP